MTNELKAVKRKYVEPELVKQVRSMCTRVGPSVASRSEEFAYIVGMHLGRAANAETEKR